MLHLAWCCAVIDIICEPSVAGLERPRPSVCRGPVGSSWAVLQVADHTRLRVVPQAAWRQTRLFGMQSASKNTHSQRFTAPGS